MKTLKVNLKTPKRTLGLLIIFTIGLSACSKDDDLVPPAPEPPEPVSGIYYKLQRVENFYIPTDDANPLIVPATVFYNLESKKIVSPALQKTTQWDIAFGGLYNSFLSGNNGANTLNHGSGSNAVGGILILKEAFDKVINVPAESEFRTAADLVGTDDSGDLGQGTGWYLYDFYGGIRSDGRYEKQHVAYALPESRTVILRTPKGDFAKIKMISCYKDAFTPDLWFRSTAHMFYTFEYVIVPKGSTRFEIR